MVRVLRESYASSLEIPRPDGAGVRIPAIACGRALCQPTRETPTPRCSRTNEGFGMQTIKVNPIDSSAACR